MLIDNFKCLLIISGQLNPFPQLVGHVSSLNSFHVQIEHSLVITNGSISTVSKRARAPIADTRHVIWISTEFPSINLGHITAVIVANDLPNDLIVLHLRLLFLLPKLTTISFIFPFGGGNHQ